jgi:CRISPR system Cascade subunit CasA
VLTWLRPWDRAASQSTLAQLEPYFIEAVRPLRLRIVNSKIVALAATSSERQIGPKSLDSGDIGDPWLPINVNDKKKGRSALTVSASGWTPDLLCRLLFQDGIECTPLQRPRPGTAGALNLVGSVLVRGKGTTDGFHAFTLPVSARACSWLTRPEDRDRLAKHAKEMLGDAKEVERILRGAIVALAQGGPEPVDFGDDSLQAWSRAVVHGFTLGWPERFFPALWQCVESDPQAVRAACQANLVARARTALEDAQTRVPLPTARRLRAHVKARGFLEASLRTKGLLPERADVTPEEELVWRQTTSPAAARVADRHPATASQAP